MKKLICFLFGHTPIKGLFETNELISNKGCKRCGIPIITSGRHWKGIRLVPPPGGSKPEWDAYCDKIEEKLRKEFAS